MNQKQDNVGEAVVLLDVDLIQPNPLQPRDFFNESDLDDLVKSIKKHGILEPLIIAHTPAGYQIIAGERRWRSAKIAGLKQVPAIVKEVTPQKMLEMAIVENVQREDLNPIERAIAFQRLIQEFGLTEKELAEQIGKSTPYVINSLRLLNLPDALKDGLIAGLISEGHARALVGIPDPHSMIQAYKQVLKESASVRRTEEIARKFKEMLLGINAARPMSKSKDMPLIDESLYVSQKKLPQIERKLQETLAEKLKIKNAKKKFSIKLKRTVTQTSITLKLKGNPLETNEQIRQLLNHLFGNEGWLDADKDKK